MKGRAFESGVAFAVSVGAVAQIGYIFLAQVPFISGLLLGVFCLLGASVAIASVQGRNDNQVQIRAFLSLTPLWMAFAALISIGASSGSLILMTDVWLSLLLLSLGFLSAATASQSKTVLSVTIPIIACMGVVQFYQSLLHGANVTYAVDATSVRYGYTNGLNIINSVGTNLAIAAASGYLLARSENIPRAWRWWGAFSLAVFLLPVFATGSRAAIISLVIVIAVKEASYLKVRSALKTGALAIVAFGIVALFVDRLRIVLSGQVGELLQFVWERIELLSPADLGDSARAVSLKSALGLEGWDFLFGSGMDASVYLGTSPDNMLTNIMIGSGFFGLMIVMLNTTSTMYAAKKDLRLTNTSIALVLFPLVVRALSEGVYLPQSIFFSFTYYVLIVVRTDPGFAWRSANRLRPSKRYIGQPRSGSTPQPPLFNGR